MRARDRLRRSLASRRAEVVALGYRTRQVVLFAAVTGAVTGLGVAAFEAVTRKGLFDHLAEAPLWLQVVAPIAGLGLAALALRWLAAGATPTTSDEYIRNFHEPSTPLDLRPVPGRLAASVATLGLGGAMGYEGPSMYLGAAIGSGLQRRFSRHFSREDTKVLLVAGAAAGVSAIFKAPATGLVFALEVPYQEDFAAAHVASRRHRVSRELHRVRHVRGNDAAVPDQWLTTVRPPRSRRRRGARDPVRDRRTRLCARARRRQESSSRGCTRLSARWARAFVLAGLALVVQRCLRRAADSRRGLRQL